MVHDDPSTCYSDVIVVVVVVIVIIFVEVDMSMNGEWMKQKTNWKHTFNNLEFFFHF